MGSPKGSTLHWDWHYTWCARSRTKKPGAHHMTDVVFQLSNDATLPVDQENCKELVFEKMEALRKAASAHADTYREKVQGQAKKGRKPHDFKRGRASIQGHPHRGA